MGAASGTARNPMGPRPRAAVSRLPQAPGVYRFIAADGRALYIGRAVELRRRVASYCSDLRDRRHLTPMVAAIDRIEAVVCDSAHEAAWLERNLLERAMPEWNRTAGGQEVPVHIRLDTRPATPGLTVVHTVGALADVHHFGPYLGGDRVRLAVSGLERVLPLAYTNSGPSGSQRDLAARRGVGPHDRAALAEALSAVLRGDPAAIALVRQRLRARVDRAVDVLAFELAARLQAEIEATEWVTCPQRVTLADARAFDAAGWADGVLVAFEVRAGRLGVWTQRACTRRAAGPYLLKTPANWVEFLDRNAQLAARLAR